jgi:uncharacterized protein YuzE
MKVHYDPEVDAVYLKLGDTQIVESEELRPGIVVDLDSQDRVVAIEILHVRKQFPEADLRLQVA